ncbi:MAG: hypothetical protein WA364_20315 [Candidatus Nitrosopolaris sp.]
MDTRPLNVTTPDQLILAMMNHGRYSKENAFAESTNLSTKRYYSRSANPSHDESWQI